MRRPSHPALRPFHAFVLALVALAIAGRSGGHAQALFQALPYAPPTAVDRGFLTDAARLAGGPGQRDARGLERTRLASRPGARGSRYTPGRVLVKFRRGLTSAIRSQVMRSVASARGMEPRQSHADFDVLRIGDDEDAETVARALSARGDVEYAQPAYRVSPRFVPNDTFYSQLQWNFRNINLERAWDIQPGATDSIIVAILDSGLAFRSVTLQYTAGPFTSEGKSYPALGTVSVPFVRATDLATDDSRFVAPHDFIWDNALPVDLDGHGTHVAGTIGELTNNGAGVAGIAFNARLMPVKVISTTWDDIFNSPEVGTDETVALGIRYAADNGAKVINMSIGRTGIIGSAPVVEDAIRYAVGKGAFVAIAGGNEFDEGNSVEVIAEIASRVPGAMSVAATDRSGNRAPYSTTGPWVEIAAPGGSFLSGGTVGLVYQQTYDFDVTDTFTLPPSLFTGPRFDVLAYQGFEGTSMAAPHVAGLAALLIQQGVTKPAAVEAALRRFATDKGAPGRDNEFGFGQIDALATLRGLGLAR